MVGDGHTMRVATQILQYVFRATERAFQVVHPVLSEQWPQPGSEDIGFCEEVSDLPGNGADRSGRLA